MNSVEVFRDTLRTVTDFEDGVETLELEPYRQYHFSERIAGKNYLITLSHPMFETEDLLSICLVTGLFFVILLLLGLNLFNRFISHKVWRPFHEILQQMSDFNLKRPAPFQLKDSNVDEFDDLKSAVQAMTSKISRDYEALDEFTVNASHEMQTPVAIIQSQLDLLLQSDFNPSEGARLARIQKQLTKLNNLNRTLLLLTRIKHDQFIETKASAVHELLEQKIEELRFLMEGRRLELVESLEKCIVAANPHLLGLVIHNLMINAIIHNTDDGQIKVTCETGRLKIGNSGSPLGVEPEDLFRRFSKSDQARDSNGLGLALVSEICEYYDWKLSYNEASGWHELEIAFESDL